MVYPRASRAKVERRAADVDRARPAFDAKAELDVRVGALWSLRGAPSDTALERGTVAECVGELLNDDDLVLASEAYEALCRLHVDDGAAEHVLGVGLDRRGRLLVPPKRIDAYVNDAPASRLVPLAKIAVHAPSTQVPLLQWPRVVAGNDLVIERTASARLRGASIRVRGDLAFVGAQREAALNVSIPRRHLRFKRTGDAWSVQDVYAEGFVSIGGTRLTLPANVAHGTRIDVKSDDGTVGATLTVRLAPKLDRTKGVTVRFRDRGDRVERLAAGEALFLGPHEDDDVATAIPAHIVAGADGTAVLLAAVELTQVKGVIQLGGGVGVKFDRDDVVLVDT